MPQRFDYTHLSPEQFQSRLADLGWKPLTFARVFGVRENTIKRWLSGENTVPPWVHVALTLLQLPGAPVAARDAAAEHIVRDNLEQKIEEKY
jgi:transcriptional regulator with XRE-family HTH domain